MKIDADKIKKVLIQSISDLRHGAHESEDICIGDLNDEAGQSIQIHVTVTRDDNEFFEIRPEYECITYK